MIERIATHLLLRPEDIRPSRPDWEVIGVFNPGIARFDGQTILLARVAERPLERRSGWTALPRWEANRGYVIDRVRNEELEARDPRVVRHLATGLVRLTSVSHLRVLRNRDGRTVDDFDGFRIVPANESEEFGIEDPRITRLDERYYITYVAVSRHGPATALASTTNFKTFERHGVIFCPENKDVVLFPERIDGQYAALHRQYGDMPFCRPEMWIASSPDLKHWGAHNFLFAGAGDWEDGRVGGGAPPIDVPKGWLVIYHGSRRPKTVGGVGAYCGGAMLLTKGHPIQISKVSREAILEPQAEFEMEGYVNRVVFPTGVIEEQGRLLIYYGAADKYCAMAEVSLSDVMRTLQ